MAKKKSSENKPNIEEKAIAEAGEQAKTDESAVKEETQIKEPAANDEKTDEFEGLTDAEKLLLAKEERFLNHEDEEEVE